MGREWKYRPCTCQDPAREDIEVATGVVRTSAGARIGISFTDPTFSQQVRRLQLSLEDARAFHRQLGEQIGRAGDMNSKDAKTQREP